MCSFGDHEHKFSVRSVEWPNGVKAYATAYKLQEFDKIGY